MAARQNIPVNRPGWAGADPAETVGDVNGMSFINDGATLLEVRNPGAAPESITIVTPAVVASGLAIADVSITVANDATPVLAGPFPEQWFNNADGTCWITTTTTNLRFRAWSTRS